MLAYYAMSRNKSARALEHVFDSFAGALQYFASALCGANSHILSGVYRAFAQVGSCVNGMKGHQVGGRFPRSLSCAPGAFGRPLADISRAAAHVMFSTSVYGSVRLRAIRGLRGIRRLRDGNPGQAQSREEPAYIHTINLDESRLPHVSPFSANDVGAGAPPGQDKRSQTSLPIPGSKTVI
jgi:hypothetical protein